MVNVRKNVDHIQIRQIMPPRHLAKIDYYITKVTWYDNDRILIVWTTRNQTESTLVICDRFKDWTCDELYRLKGGRGWVDGFENGLLSGRHHDCVLVRIPKCKLNFRRNHNHFF